MSVSKEFVSLRGGLTVPAEPFRLLFSLLDRGFSLTPDQDALVVRPAQRLTVEDHAQITRWKPHLLALLAYEPPEMMV